MSEFPKGIRPGGPRDQLRLYELFMIAHAENGFGSVDESTVRAMVARLCATDGREGVVGLIDGAERLEAAIGLRPDKLWYNAGEASDFFWTEVLVYIHPLHRRTRHAAKLFKFASWWAEQTGSPVVLNVLPKDDMERKERLFSRHGTRIGSTFLVNTYPTIH